MLSRYAGNSSAANPPYTSDKPVLISLSGGVISGNVTITGNLAVTGTTTLTGALIAGAASFSSPNGITTLESPGISSVGLQFKTNSTNRFKLETPNASTDLVAYADGVTEIARFSPTGLLITGALSSTDLISKINSAATTSQFLNVSGSTTAATYADITNTSGVLRIGVESSVGGILTIGSSPYAAVVGSNSAAPLHLSVNGIIIATASSTGLEVVSPLVLSQATLLTTNVALTNGAGAAAGTLLNAPAAGDPTKWIPIDDNGTVRHIPAW